MLKKHLDVLDRFNSQLYLTCQIGVDPPEEVVPQPPYAYSIFLSVDIDWLIRSQVCTSERGGWCWDSGGSHCGSCCQSNYRVLHHWRQRGRWVSSELFICRAAALWLYCLAVTADKVAPEFLRLSYEHLTAIVTRQNKETFHFLVGVPLVSRDVDVLSLLTSFVWLKQQEDKNLQLF